MMPMISNFSEVFNSNIKIDNNNDTRKKDNTYNDILEVVNLLS